MEKQFKFEENFVLRIGNDKDYHNMKIENFKSVVQAIKVFSRSYGEPDFVSVSRINK